MVKTCKECEWSIVEKFELICLNDRVIETNPKALSSVEPGVNCFNERNKIFFGVCGRSGKLWRKPGKLWKKKGTQYDDR